MFLNKYKILNISKTYILFVFLVFSLSVNAEQGLGFVNFGAFVLSEVTDKNSGLYNRVGYLPIGAVVSYDKSLPPKEIFNHSTNVQDYEDYLRVKSNVGFTGFVKKEQITALDGQILLIPLRYDLYIRHIDTNEVIGKLNRAEKYKDSMPVKVIEKSGDYYIVELSGVKFKKEDGGFTFETTQYPIDEKFFDEAGNIRGKIHVDMVKLDKLIKLAPDEHKKFPVILVKNYIGFTEEDINALISKVTDKLDSDELNKIKEQLKRYGDLQCRISAKANAELNAKFLGTGFGFNVKLMLAGENSVFSISSINYIRNGQNLSEYYQAVDVKCENANPSRMRTIAYLNKSDPEKNLHLKSDQLPDRLKNNWKTFSEKEAYKMINVSGFEDYISFMKHIEDANFFGSMSQDDRRVMKHVLLKQVANFRTPKD